MQRTTTLLIFFAIALFGVSAGNLSNDSIFVQQCDTIINDIMVKDALYTDSLYLATIGSSNDSTVVAPATETKSTKSRFRPDPAKATWLAIAIPGGGQIYNRKYWKLPIVYGGFVGCMYAYNWNNQMYTDYKQAYLDIMDSDPNTKSYEGFFRKGYDYEANKSYLQNVFKKRKDRYRRWRDMSIFVTIGVYLISVIDAYVDAQLSSFDISENLDLSISPQLIKENNFGHDGNYYGFNCNLSF